MKNKGIPIYIGTSNQPCDRIQEQILVYTLQKNTRAKLDIHFLRANDFPGVSSTGWGTPFTGLRYAIPMLQRNKGKAIYMDMDMINFRDIEEYYNINLYGKPFGMCWDAAQFNKKNPTQPGSFCDSMMLIDCGKTDQFFHWNEILDWRWSTAFKWTFMERIAKWEDKKDRQKNDVVIKIDSRWNSFDGSITDEPVSPHRPEWWDKPQYELDMIFHLHLTALSYQPWHSKYLHAAKATHYRKDITDYWWKLVDEVRSLEV